MSDAGEVSFVLAGAFGWRHTVRSVALERDGALTALTAVIDAVAGVLRVNAALPPDRADGTLVLLDADGVVLELPTPSLAELVPTRLDPAAGPPEITERTGE